MPAIIVSSMFGISPKTRETLKTLKSGYFKCLDLRENLTAIGIHCSGTKFPNAKFSAANDMGGILLDHRYPA